MRHLVLALIIIAAASPAFAQQEQTVTAGAPYKLEPIDPTKNVIDLVKALKETLAELRTADNKYRDDMRSAETRRINELAEQKERNDAERARSLQTAAEASAKLLADQLKEVKSDFNARVHELEKFRWETGGQGTTLITIMMIISLLAAVAGPIIAVYAIKSRLPPRPSR